MSERAPIIYIVDDDPAVCDAVGFVSDEFRAREQRLAMARSAGAGARGLLRADDEDDE